MARLFALILVGATIPGCLMPVTQPLNSIDQKLETTNDQLARSNQKLDESNLRLAQIEKKLEESNRKLAEVEASMKHLLGANAAVAAP